MKKLLYEKTHYMKKVNCFIILIMMYALYGCSDNSNALEVTATAYTSSVGETDSTPWLAAWGDTLTPDTRSIAVSRDLIKIGLGHGAEVSIDGIDGTFKVLDKMNKRWTKKIDIYMGENTKKAKEWGKKQVVIRWANDP